jgi:F0F1-type ATP synthase assembly protein I
MNAAEPSADTVIRPLAARILRVQFAVALGAGLIGWLGYGRDAGLSALGGGLIGVIANLYMTFNALRPSTTATGALGRLLFGQLVKVGLTVAMFVAAARMPGLIWPALLVSYLATLVVFWWVPLRAGRRSSM